MTKYLKFKTPAADQAGDLASDYKLVNHGLVYIDKVFWNLPAPALFEEAIFRGEAKATQGGALVVHTGKWTARAAADKYIVREPVNNDNINWGEYNRPLDNDKFGGLFNRIQAFLQGEELFVQDVFAGADPEHAMPVRIITTHAWQSLFAHNMFVKPRTRDEYRTHVPEFTLIAVPNFKLDPRIDGTAGETGIIIDFARRMAIIANTHYAGEIKKTIFTMMNYYKPLDGVMAMHCSANVGKAGDAALFFGLSGTGKTTLSADPERMLIGDDEHGWSDNGIFNFEAGCYAKVIRLSAEAEPEIHACTHMFGSILENVVWNPTTRKIDLNDDQLTENTRISYPLEFIPNAIPEKMTNHHPKNVIFLTADAQGVLPPIAQLDVNQAMYHFISGYTSKIAGTELGLGTEPEITFSACFGAPFMVHHPFFYANLLRRKIEAYGSKVWLVNTGWVGGKFGIGKRISIRHTRNMLNAVLNGQLDTVEFRTDSVFGFKVPLTCPNVPEEVFIPENAWANKAEYWQKYDALAARYLENFRLFEAGVSQEVIDAKPKRVKK
ncbi:MAG TPA: phosphoenolpyruvate carboxykinase (ATP) [Bacteroidales bacterium]|nr:phosphoenolpyruvate carboxykinase (ATP) [Bacteroidales bacterium]